MKQFNLEEYLKNPSRKIVTRDGRNARIVCTDRKGFNSILALVTRHDSITEDIYLYTKNGELSEGNSTKSSLFFASKKYEGWVNIYHMGDRMWCGNIFRTEDSAKKCSNLESYSTTIKIEWEE